MSYIELSFFDETANVSSKGDIEATHLGEHEEDSAILTQPALRLREMNIVERLLDDRTDWGERNGNHVPVDPIEITVRNRIRTGIWICVGRRVPRDQSPTHERSERGAAREDTS
jgi:hypothetical protein